MTRNQNAFAEIYDWLEIHDLLSHSNKLDH